MKPFVSSLCALIFAIPAYATSWQSTLNQDHPQVGKLYDLSTQQEITTTDLFKRLRQADIVMVGEKHDNPDHHRIESDILSALLISSDNPSVILEMLDDSQQDGIALANIAKNPETLKTTLNWDDKRWAWQDYGPIMQQVLKANGELHAGNISRQQIRAIYSEGATVIKSDPRLTSALKVDDKLRSAMLDNIYAEHCEMMPRQQLTPMVNIQLARDARMASALNQAKASQVVLIAGGYHVRKKSAVPLHLRLINSTRQPVVVMLSEVDPTLQNYSKLLNELQTEADYVWFTPRFTDRDYCEDFRASKN